MTKIPACWEAADAKAILSTEALEGGKKVFLATHVPVQDFHVGGASAGEVKQRTDRGLLDALAKPGVRHAFCVVEGEPGSGKSHLVRWLNVKWPAKDDLVLLIQRLDGSLQGTLRQLRHSVPSEFQYLFEALGRPQELTKVGRSRVFHTNLAHALEPTHFAHPLPDADWCGQFRLSEMLRDNAVLEGWRAPERIMELLSGKKGRRDQELARFNLDDIVELELIVRSLKAPSVKAVRFARELQKEVDGIRQLSAEEKRNPALQDELRRRFQNSVQFVDALNLRRNNAVQGVLGISSEGLKELFIQLRRGLKDRRLVLLLEDITSWEGVDNQLIDVLVTNVQTRQDSDLCPMVSVVGITPLYFSEKGFQANYRQRITHHIRLGEEHSGNQYQDVAGLRTADEQITFATAYLRAIRAGTKRLEEWDSDEEQLPNKCDACPYRTGCHDVFGQRGGVGLFPFNGSAITKLFGMLTDPQHKSTYQTPRGMIQGVLAPTLDRSRDELNAGRYPDQQMAASEWIPEDKRHLRGLPSSILDARSIDEGHRERLERIVVFWGDSEAVARQTTADQTGRLQFAGLPRELYEAFQCPWPGDDVATPVVERPEPKPEEKKEGTGGVQPPPSGGRLPIKATPQPGTVPKGSPLPPSELRGLLQDLDRWADGKPVEQEAKLNQATFDIVETLNFSQLDIAPWVRKRFFTRENLILEGTRKERAQSFVIKREDWVRKGLEAYVTLRTTKERLEIPIEESHQRHYAAFVRTLKRTLRARVESRVPRVKGGAKWAIEQTATQMLLARNWLRGTVSPLSDPSKQWKAILHDEVDATSSPQDRVDSWNEVITKTGGGHGMVRAMLRDLVNLPMDSSGHMLLLNAGTSAQAIQFLCKSLKFSPFPEIKGAGQQLAELETLCGYAKDVDQRLARLPKYELERLKSTVDAVNDVLNGTSIPEHLERTLVAIDKVSELLPTAAPVLVRAWANAASGLRDNGFFSRESSGPSADIERFIDSVLDLNAEALSKEPAKLLDWVTRAPANSLRTLHEGTKQATAAVKALTDFASQFINSGPGGEGGGLASIHEVGLKITSTVDAASEALGKGNGSG